MRDFQNKRAAVLGLGVSNTPLIRWLLERGAAVTARDRKEFALLPEAVKEFAAQGVRFICGEQYLEDLDEEILFRSPGIRFDRPELLRAVASGAELTSEMELFFSLCPCRIIGVTGSDGKTTTTTLISECLAAAYGRERVFVGGNIGKPLLPELDRMDAGCFAVVELSSFQLHTMRVSPDIAVITNISPNHLDYHRDMAEYIDAKKNIFLHAKPGSVVVLNRQNPVTASLGVEVPDGAELRWFLGENADIRDGCLLRRGERVLKLSDILIPGRHNQENFAAVIAALDGLVSDEMIRTVAASFRGVAHRIEAVRELDGVRYYNSSIDSSPTRTAAALRSFPQKTIVICGGYDKHIPFEPLADVLCEKAKRVILTGATAEKIREVLICRSDCPPYTVVPDFREAVLTARAQAEAGDIVILSPACASFDAFPNFEARGNTFKEIVRSF